MKNAFPVFLALAILSGVLAAVVVGSWALLQLFGFLDVPAGFESVMAVPLLCLLAPYVAYKLLFYARWGVRDEAGCTRSPFLPRQETQDALSRALAPLDEMGWERLKGRLWKLEKQPVALEGCRAASVEAGVFPGGYRFSGGNFMLFERLRDEVAGGGPVAIVATLSARRPVFPWLELMARERRVISK